MAESTAGGRECGPAFYDARLMAVTASSALPPRSAIATEAVAGVTTFFTMAYILVVNPTILSTQGTGMPFSGVLTATVLLCVSMTMLMGLYARLPYGVAPGMGLNAFFTYTIILQGGVPWPVALGIVFWAGVLFLVVSATPLRESVAMAIPEHLRAASAAGIGLLLTFIGLQNGGFVAANPATMVGVGPLDHRAVLTMVGVGVIVVLSRRENPLAFLASIATVSAAGWALGDVRVPERWLSAPDFTSVLFKLDVVGALQLSLVPSIVAIAMTDLFDSISSFIGVSQAAGLVDEKGQPLRLRQGLIVDSFATLGAGLLGTSSGTAYVESIAGIRMGGRTGLTAVVAALCFLPCLFIAPLAGAVPPYATSAVLLVVGVSMFRTVTRVGWDRLEEALPAYVAVVLIPLTFSITQGLLWGFVLHAALHALVGRARDVRPMLWGLAVLAAVLLVLEHTRH